MENNVERVYRAVESPADRAAQLAALRRLVAEGRCVCGASEDLVRRQYRVGGDGWRWFWECKDQARCQQRQRLRMAARLVEWGE